MTPEIHDILMVVVGILIVLSVSFAASKFKAKNIIKEDTLLVICDIVDLVSDVSLTSEDNRNIAQAVISVVEFVQTSMAKETVEIQKEKAINMLRGLSAVIKIEQLSDEDIVRIVNMAFVLMKK